MQNNSKIYILSTVQSGEQFIYIGIKGIAASVKIFVGGQVAALHLCLRFLFPFVFQMAINITDK